MTAEQQIQYALRASLRAALDAASLQSVPVHAQKLDAVDDQQRKAVYPVITVATTTPVPAGHQSAIIDVSAWVRVMVYLPDDPKKNMFGALCEVVFNALHRRDDWTPMLPEDHTVAIPAVTISGGDEPGIVPDFILEQTTNITVNASLDVL